MKIVNALSACLLSFTLLAGCGNTVNSLFGDMTATPDMAVTVHAIENGNYQLLKINNEMDGCKIDDGTLLLPANAIYTLMNDNMGNITMQGFGTGQVLFNMGTLTKNKTGVMSGMTCTYDYARSYMVNVTADNTFTLTGSEVQTNRLMTCIPMTGATCTTSWALDFKKM